MTSAVKNIELIFFMIDFLLVPPPNVLTSDEGAAIFPAWLR
jgi:hypothetical protein